MYNITVNYTDQGTLRIPHGWQKTLWWRSLIFQAVLYRLAVQINSAWGKGKNREERPSLSSRFFHPFLGPNRKPVHRLGNAWIAALYQTVIFYRASDFRWYGSALYGLLYQILVHWRLTEDLSSVWISKFSTWWKFHPLSSGKFDNQSILHFLWWLQAMSDRNIVYVEIWSFTH